MKKIIIASLLIATVSAISAQQGGTTTPKAKVENKKLTPATKGGNTKLTPSSNMVKTTDMTPAGKAVKTEGLPNKPATTGDKKTNSSSK